MNATPGAAPVAISQPIDHTEPEEDSLAETEGLGLMIVLCAQGLVWLGVGIAIGYSFAK